MTFNVFKIYSRRYQYYENDPSNPSSILCLITDYIYWYVSNPSNPSSILCLIMDYWIRVSCTVSKEKVKVLAWLHGTRQFSVLVGTEIVRRKTDTVSNQSSWHLVTGLTCLSVKFSPFSPDFILEGTVSLRWSGPLGSTCREGTWRLEKELTHKYRQLSVWAHCITGTQPARCHCFIVHPRPEIKPVVVNKNSVGRYKASNSTNCACKCPSYP